MGLGFGGRAGEGLVRTQEAGSGKDEGEQAQQGSRLRGRLKPMRRVGWVFRVVGEARCPSALLAK